MEVTFSEGGRYKFACYRLTYEESKSPDRIAKIKADLASKGKDGYSIAITYDASPTPPTWDTFANSLLCLDRRLEMWKLMQESWLHHKAVEAQKGVSKMSTSYFIFTEVLANDQWHCINPQVMKLLPIEHLILVPTLRSDSRYQFEKAYRQLECDGHPFTVDEMSRNLQAAVNDWLTPEDSVRIAVCYDDILKLLNTSGKEHSAFALRSEVAAFQNGEWRKSSRIGRCFSNAQILTIRSFAMTSLVMADTIGGFHEREISNQISRKQPDKVSSRT